MQTTQSLPVISRMRGFVLALSALPLAACALLAQDADHTSKKPSPPKIETQFFVVGEPVVQVQWPHTLKLVNAPQNVTLLNPGQCVRVGILSTGDGRDEYLDKTKLSFRVKFAGQSQDHALAALAQIKQIKPEGADFAMAIAAAADLKVPPLTLVSLGVSADNWCVPADAADGEATVEAEVESPSGHQTLKRSTIQIESFETGSKRPFKNEEELEGFFMTYYRHPNPARLFAALQFFAADTKARENRGTPESTAATIGSALRANSVAAKDFMARVSAQTGFTRAFGLIALRFGGYDIDPAVNAMSEEDRQKFARYPTLPDPNAMSADGENATRLDMLWGVFMATGAFEPVEKIAGTLGWRSDWEALDKLIKTPNHPTDWTPSIARAVTYAAAGWALGSFQRNDPLAADYIEFMLASPDVSPLVKSELKGLLTNPAFKMTNGK